MIMLATDLDRTLFPNGLQEYDNTMPRLHKLLEERKDIMPVFATGRNKQETMAGIAEFGAPWPVFAVCEVGTRIYRMQDGELLNDPAWDKHVAERTQGWDQMLFHRTLLGIQGLRLQAEEHQNPFKISYYVESPQPHDPRADEAHKLLRPLCPDADVIYSVDETNHIGLLDILPRAATKLAGLKYLWKNSGLNSDDVIYAGDSGNDLLPLTCGCRAILVRNAVDDVREIATSKMAEKNMADRLYCAKGAYGLNGNYVSGIIEGLIHFGVIQE